MTERVFPPDLPEDLERIGEDELRAFARAYQLAPRWHLDLSSCDPSERLLAELHRRELWIAEMATAVRLLIEADMMASPTGPIYLDFPLSPATEAMRDRLAEGQRQWMADDHHDHIGSHYMAAGLAIAGHNRRMAEKEQRARVVAAVTAHDMSEAQAAVIAGLARRTVRRLLGK